MIECRGPYARFQVFRNNLLSLHCLYFKSTELSATVENICTQPNHQLHY